MEKTLKWVGMIVCVLCMLATSFNVNPTNVYLGVLGNSIWAFAGWISSDLPLTVTSIVSTGIFVLGIVISIL